MSSWACFRLHGDYILEEGGREGGNGGGGGGAVQRQEKEEVGGRSGGGGGGGCQDVQLPSCNVGMLHFILGVFLRIAWGFDIYIFVERLDVCVCACFCVRVNS